MLEVMNRFYGSVEDEQQYVCKMGSSSEANSETTMFCMFSCHIITYWVFVQIMSNLKASLFKKHSYNKPTFALHYITPWTNFGS